VLAGGGLPTDAAAAEAAARALDAADLERGDLRSPPVDQAASQVAAVPGVRAALLDFQRAFGRARGAVLDGRDIGTVVFPDATVKLFVTASAEARAERRWRERDARGEAIPLPEVAAEMASATRAMPGGTRRRCGRRRTRPCWIRRRCGRGVFARAVDVVRAVAAAQAGAA
jgi:cytidylate kinase